MKGCHQLHCLPFPEIAAGSCHPRKADGTGLYAGGLLVGAAMAHGSRVTTFSVSRRWVTAELRPVQRATVSQTQGYKK